MIIISCIKLHLYKHTCFPREITYRTQKYKITVSEIYSHLQQKIYGKAEKLYENILDIFSKNNICNVCKR